MIAKQLVAIQTVNPRIVLDIRYATPNNFTGRTLYSAPLCYVHPHTAEALDRIQTELEKQKLGLKVFDGYRPLSVQQLMWDSVQDDKYVANPAKQKSRHTRGTAVDVTLVDAQGNELAMPSEFDDFSEKAHLNWQGGSKEAIQNRDFLIKTMRKYGFETHAFEWWHFDLKGWNNESLYPCLNFSFEDLLAEYSAI